MKLYNLRHPDEQVSFAQAVKLGMGRDRGLFFPTEIPVLKDAGELLRLPFVERLGWQRTWHHYRLPHG